MMGYIDSQRAAVLQSLRLLFLDRRMNPLEKSADDAALWLDDIPRLWPGSAAAVWVARASDHQLRLFARDWRRWLRQVSERVEQRGPWWQPRLYEVGQSVTVYPYDVRGTIVEVTELSTRIWYLVRLDDGKRDLSVPASGLSEWGYGIW